MCRTVSGRRNQISFGSWSGPRPNSKSRNSKTGTTSKMQLNSSRKKVWCGLIIVFETRQRKADAAFCTASGLFAIYNGSVASCLVNVYPSHNWQPWRFSVSPIGFWSTVENQRKFMDWLSQEQGISKLPDWYDLNNQKLIVKHGGTHILQTRRQTERILLTIFFSLSAQDRICCTFMITPYQRCYKQCIQPINGIHGCLLAPQGRS